MLLLNREDVSDIFNLADAIEIAEDAYREQGNGSVVAFPRHSLVSKKSHASISGGALDDSSITALRMSVGNPTDGTHDAAFLFDVDTGNLLSVMAYEFSPLRSAGMVGFVTRTLSNPSSSTLCMIGTGRRAFDYLRVACMVRPIEEIRVFSRTEQNRSAFAAQMQKELNRPVISAGSLQEATQRADIVYVSTNSRSPVLSVDDLEDEPTDGRLVASMGGVLEMDESIYLKFEDTFVSDKARVLRHWSGDDASRSQIGELVGASKISESSIHEVGAALMGNISPSSLNGGTTVFKDFAGGSGFGDAALCLAAYRRCLELGRGQRYEIH